MALTDKLTTIAENEEKVFEAGKLAEYNAFWDDFQQNGERTFYNYGFASHFGWTENNFKPKYDVIPSQANYIFYGFKQASLKPFFDYRGLKLDFSRCTNLQGAFTAAELEELGVIDLSSAGSNTANMFNNCRKLATIDKLVFGSTTKMQSTTFTGCSELQNILEVEGEIVTNIFVSACSNLTHDSLMVLANALQPKTSGTYSFSIGLTNQNKLSEAEKAMITEKGWSLA